MNWTSNAPINQQHTLWNNISVKLGADCKQYYKNNYLWIFGCTSNIYTTIYRVKRSNNRTRSEALDCLTVQLGQSWYKWCVTWNHAISHLGRWLLNGSLRVIQLRTRFKVCSFSYLRVLFHSSQLLHTFWYINHKKIKGKECIDVTKFKYLTIHNITID